MALARINALRHVENLRDGSVLVHDPRSLDDAKAEALARIRDQAAQRIADLADGPQAQLVQVLALGLLQANSGTAFASWPAAARNAWTNQVDPIVTAMNAIRTARAAAVAAVNAAATNDAADAVLLA